MSFILPKVISLAEHVDFEGTQKYIEGDSQVSQNDRVIIGQEIPQIIFISNSIDLKFTFFLFSRGDIKQLKKNLNYLVNPQFRQNKFLNNWNLIVFYKKKN